MESTRFFEVFNLALRVPATSAPFKAKGVQMADDIKDVRPRQVTDIRIERDGPYDLICFTSESHPEEEPMDYTLEIWKDDKRG